MEEITKQAYQKGFRDGTKAGNEADFKIKLVQVLDKTKGVGPKLTKNILNTLKEMEK